MKKKWIFWLLLLILTILLIALFRIYHQKEKNTQINKKISALEDSLVQQNNMLAVMKKMIFMDFIIPDSMQFYGQWQIFSPTTKESIRRKVEFLFSRPYLLVRLLRQQQRYSDVLDSLQSGGRQDLQYVAMQESALNAQAVSWAKAVGLWQFIHRTGRAYGLKIDRFIDERRDPYLSTLKAQEYIDDLMKEFDNNVALALAAYNYGPGRIKKAVLVQKTSDYFGLRLPSETANYFEYILAWKIIFQYNNNLLVNFPVDLYSLKAVRFQVNFKKNISLSNLIDYWQGSYDIFLELNPKYHANIIPSGEQVLYVPEEKSHDFSNYLQKNSIVFSSSP